MDRPLAGHRPGRNGIARADQHHRYLPNHCGGGGGKLPPGRAIDGVSLVGHLKSGGKEKLKREALVWHFPHYRHAPGPYSIIRAGDWKLTKFYEGPKLELYNLKDDLGEKTDLAAKMPAKVKELHEKLTAHLTAVGAKLPRPNPNYVGPGKKAGAGQTKAVAEGRVETLVYQKTPQAELAMPVHFPAGWKAANRRPAIVRSSAAVGRPARWHSSGRRRSSWPGAAWWPCGPTTAGRAGTMARRTGAPRTARARSARCVATPRSEASTRADRGGWGSAGGHTAAAAAIVPDLEPSGEDLKTFFQTPPR
jgi:hypothetical protein